MFQKSLKNYERQQNLCYSSWERRLHLIYKVIYRIRFSWSRLNLRVAYLPLFHSSVVALSLNYNLSHDLRSMILFSKSIFSSRGIKWCNNPKIMMSVWVCDCVISIDAILNFPAQILLDTKIMSLSLIDLIRVILSQYGSFLYEFLIFIDVPFNSSAPVDTFRH